MEAKQVLARFEAFLSAHRDEVVAGPPEVGFAAMLGFYEEQRIEGCELESDGDMLLVQWGTFDWGEGPEFELDLTRQVLFPDEEGDDAIWQLHLTYHYQPTSDLRALGANERWCSSPAEVSGFRAFIEACKPYQLLRARSAAKVSAFVECAA